MGRASWTVETQLTVMVGGRAVSLRRHIAGSRRGNREGLRKDTLPARIHHYFRPTGIELRARFVGSVGWRNDGSPM